MKEKCLVIIVAFDKDRDGVDADIKAIQKTFSTEFNTELDIMLNWNKEAIIEKFNGFSDASWRDKFRSIKFLAIFCLSHGHSDGQVVLKTENEVTDARRLLLCPFFKIEELDGKLKWLVVQACRGHMGDYQPLPKDGKPMYFPDIHFISYCTGEGTVSFQKGEGGKIYIQSLCKELSKNIRNLSLCQMLENVHTAVEEFGKTQQCVKFSRPDLKKNADDYWFYTPKEAPSQPLGIGK
ncbi:caspase-3-like [Haematobia irritans]|uniref:Putative caspase n=1 Tax=Haematobia irritans TaxID=7368 RepID=A0A1L8EAI2_HAEIR